MRITVVKGKQRRTFRKVESAKKWAGKARRLTVIVTN